MLRHLIFLGSIFLCACVQAQDGITVDAGSAPSAPPEAKAAEKSVLEAVIAEIRAELTVLEGQWEKDQQELSEEIRSFTESVFNAASKETDLRNQVTELQKKLDEKEFNRFEAEAKRDSLKSMSAAVGSELRNQIADLNDRFSTGVFSLEAPDFGPSLAAKLELENLDENRDIDFLLQRFNQVLDAAETTSSFKTDVQVVAAERRVVKADVLRLGLVDNYFSQGSFAGRLVKDEITGDTPEGLSEGLTSEQVRLIRDFVANPSAGGELPVDVSGGAGFASLAAGDSWAEWFEKGGNFMWGLVALAVFSLLMIFERVLVLFIKSMGIQASVDKVLKPLQSGDIEAAIQTARSLNNPVGTVMLAALENSDQPEEIIESSIEDAMMTVAPIYRSRLAMIALCAAVAPLMGLLGTVTGMIGTFQNLVIFGASDPRNLAGGISEALITTQGGLYVAIPSLLMRGILGSIAEKSVGKIESGAMSALIEILKMRGEIIDGDEVRTSESVIDSSPNDLLEEKPDATQDGVDLDSPEEERISG